MKRWVCMVCAAVATAGMVRSEDWTGWTRRMPVVFSGWDGAAVADFPALVKLDPTVTREMLKDGADLRFADMDGNSLPHEIDSWDTNGVSVVWVKVPLARNAVIWAYWKNDTPGSIPVNAADTWDAGHVGVWHLGEPVAGGMLDSTTNALHGTRSDVTTADGVLGAAGGAQSFPGVNGDNKYVNIPNTDDKLNVGSTFAISGWFRYHDDSTPTDDWRTYFMRKYDNNSPAGWEIGQNGNNHATIGARSGGNVGMGYYTMPDGGFNSTPRKWHLMTIQSWPWNGANRGAIYADGVFAADTAFGNADVEDSTWPLRIGSWGNGWYSWKGLVDEVRYESVIRSADWIKAQYDTVMKEGFAISLPPSDSVVDTAPITTLGAVAEWNAAEVAGFAAPSLSFPRDAWLYWGIGDWTGTPVRVTLEDAGYFSVPLEDLDDETTYFAIFALDNGDSTLTWADGSIAFTTDSIPNPEFGGVAFDYTPFATEVIVDVTRLGFNTSIIVNWDDDIPLNGAWANAATNDTVNTPGAHSVFLPLTQRGQTYACEIILASDRGNVTNETHTSFTADFDYLSGVTAAFAPGSTKVRVAVEQLGPNSALSLFIGADENTFEFVETISPGVGENVFTLPALSLASNVFFKAVFDSDTGPHEIITPFTVTHVYTWIGADSGPASWNVKENWDVDEVPNGPGALVVIPEDKNPVLDIAGVDGAGGFLFIGGLAWNCGTQANRNLLSSDGTTLVWDNPGATARIRFSGDYATYCSLILNAPQRFDGRTLVQHDYRQNAHQYYVELLAPSLTGAGTLGVESGRMRFSAAAGATNRVEVALDSPAGWTGIRGWGTVLLKDQATSFPFEGEWDGYFIMPPDGSARIQLVLDNTLLTNTYWVASLFQDNYNRLDVLNGSTLHFGAASKTDLMGRWGGNNTINVSGTGSKMFFRAGLFHCRDNTFAIRDGGLVSVQGSDMMGNANQGFSFSYGDFGSRGTRNLLELSSQLPGQPAIMELNNNNIFVTGFDSTVSLKTGGTIQGVRNFNLGQDAWYDGTGNTLLLDGGTLRCGTLNVSAANAIAPVLGDALKNMDAFPVIATAANFAEGALVTPVNKIPGLYPLIEVTGENNTINTENLSIMVDPPDNLIWKFVLGDDAQKLSLLCAVPGTLFLLK